MIALARWLLRNELQALRHEAAGTRLVAENAELQLTVLRVMYAGLLKECDSYKTRADHLSNDVASLQRRRRREIQAARTWITRTIQPRVSEN